MRLVSSPTRGVVGCAAIGLVVALTAVGCSGQKSPPRSVVVEVSNDELLSQKSLARDVVLPVGGTLKVILASNASTGFGWTADAQIGEPAVVRQTTHTVASPTSPRPGAPGSETWTFEALKAGTTTVTLVYRRPWSGETAGSRTFKANVEVR